MLPWLIGAAIVGLVAAVSSSDDDEKKEKELREAEAYAERRRAEKAAEERAAKELALKQASKLREVHTQLSALLDSAVESLDGLYEVSLDNRFSDEKFSQSTIEKTGDTYFSLIGGGVGGALTKQAQHNQNFSSVIGALLGGVAPPPERSNGGEFSLDMIEKIKNASDKEVFEDEAIESLLQTSIQNDLMFFQAELGGKLTSTKKLQKRCAAIREFEKEQVEILKAVAAIANKAVQLSS